MPRCALFRVAPLLVLIAGPPKKAGPSTVSKADRRALHAGAPSWKAPVEAGATRSVNHAKVGGDKALRGPPLRHYLLFWA